MTDLTILMYAVLAASVLALGFAYYFYRSMLRKEEGTELMKTIASHVRKGALAYLKQQYKVVTIVFVLLAAIFAVMAYFNLQNGIVWFAFLTGGFFSGLAGFFGMKTATYASARTANAARQSLNAGLQVAFRSGAVMGLTVVGLALLDISGWFLVLQKTGLLELVGANADLITITTTMLTFGMGASTQALFARVGGGIYTKAADVGADLVGKTEYNIPEDDPVRLLSAVAERLDYRKIMAAYSRYGRIEYSPKILTKVLVYGYMRKIISSRKIEQACKENICFMYLLEGQKAPDHNTISRFRSKILVGEAGQELLRQLTEMLAEAGLIDLKAVFIDGTKIEANANKYSFVWRKGQVKKLARLNERIRAELPELLKKSGIRFHIGETVQLRELKKLRKRLKAKCRERDVSFVYGKGNHKDILQKLTEKTEDWIAKYKQYIADIHICGDRNSYSRTDHDATFMHMKEDHMRNGQLKPGYNVNVATSNEFIIGTYISPDRSDVQTLIPFMEQLTTT